MFEPQLCHRISVTLRRSRFPSGSQPPLLENRKGNEMGFDKSAVNRPQHLTSTYHRPRAEDERHSLTPPPAPGGWHRVALRMWRLSCVCFQSLPLGGMVPQALTLQDSRRRD